MGREERRGLFEIPIDPELEDLFKVFARGMILELRTHTLAHVVTYDPGAQTAKVSIDVLQVMKDNSKRPTAQDPNPEKVLDPVVLENIPVRFPRGSDGAFLTFPIKPGLTGELHVHDRSLEQWLQLGAAADPISAFTHTLAHGVFYPGLPVNSNKLDPTDQTAIVLDHSTLIKVGAGASDFGALAAKVLSELQAIRTWANTHAHTGVTTGPGSTGTPAVPMPAPSSVAAEKAQLE